MSRDDIDPMDAHPCCDRCGRYLTTEEAAAAEAGESEGLCESCEEHDWHARKDAPTGADALERGRL